MLRKIFKRDTDERGATAIEYALIAALIAVVAIGAMSLVGNGISDVFNSVSTELGGAASPGPTPTTP